MPSRRSILFALGGGALAVTGLTACGESPNSKNGAKSTVLKIGMPNGPLTENHNPFLLSSAATQLGYRYIIFEPLVLTNRVKPADKPTPWLASAYEWADNYKKITFTIRDGVKFSDGQPMTVEDVKYTFELRKKYKGLNQDAIAYGDITAEGNKVIVTFTKSQFVNQRKVLEVFVIPKHQWSTMSDPATDTVKNPIGTGPFTLKSFSAQAAILTARDGYWQEAPQVKELRYTSYSDNNAQTTALGNGESEWSFVFIPNYKTVYVDKDPKHNKMWFPADMALHGLWFNTTKKPFDNPVLRRAMSMVVNRDDIFVQAESSYFYPKVDNVAGIPMPAGEAFVAPEYKGKVQKVDIEGAKKLLTDNGFTYDGNTLKDPTGKPVTITLTDPAGWSDYMTILEILKDNFSKIGIVATIDKANADAWTKAVDEGNFEACMHWTNGGATPYDLYQNVMDGAILKPVGTGGVNGNYGRFDNAEATAALAEYANAETEDARTKALNTIQKIMVEQMPMIPTSAANLGGMYSTRNWVGWPEESNPYAPAQPTLPNCVQIILKLKPAS